MKHFILVILEQIALHIPLLLGGYISFSLLKVPDLSIESAYVVGAICGYYMLSLPVALPFVFAATLLASIFGGMIVGVCSSILTQQLKLSHLLSSILTMGIFHGINQYISPAYVSLALLVNPLKTDYIPSYPELPLVVLIAIITLLATGFILNTQLGYCYAVYGTNSRFFEHYRISTSYIFMSGIMLANGLAGLSGYLFAQTNNFFELRMGQGSALLCITALIIGKNSGLRSHFFSIKIPLMGATLYFVLQQVLLKIGFNLKYFTAVQALLVLLLIAYTQSGIRNNDSLGV